MKKARRAKLVDDQAAKNKLTRADLGKRLFELVATAQAKGWSAEDTLRAEIKKRERAWRKRERRNSSS